MVSLMKNKLLLTLFREIQNSKGRFLSIFFIVFLGTAFFSGLRSTGPDMKLSASAYFKDTLLMDARLISTLGFGDKEVSLIKNVEGVHSIKGVKTKDVLLPHQKKEYLVRLMEATDKINRPYLLQGQLPTKPNEVLMDEKLFSEGGFHLGEQLPIKPGDKRPLKKDLTVDTLTITGVCHLSYFLEEDRGKSNLSDGSLDAFLLLPKEAFQSKIYSEIWLHFEPKEGVSTFDSAYKEQAESILSKLKSLENSLSKSRFDEIISEAKSKIKKNEKKLADSEAKLTKARKKLSAGERKLENERNALEKQKKLLSLAGLSPSTLPEIQEAESILSTEEKKFSKEKALFLSKIEKKEKKLSKARKKIATAKKDLAKLLPPDIYILGRDKFPSFVSFQQNAERMVNIGNVFPVIFFLVATLVSLTAMTRMVEEERISMGTLKALGFSNFQIAKKYILYSLFATVSGGGLGAYAGMKFFPSFIMDSYGILFTALPYRFSPFHLTEAIFSLLLAIVSTGGATLVSSHKSLRENPASLMRPLPPKKGKRVLPERLPFLWNRLSFTTKSTIRNLLRYKKRFFMTVFGIGSCMGLLLTGFGLRDSIQMIEKKQFVDIFTYQARVNLKETISPIEKEELLSTKSLLSDDLHKDFGLFLTIDVLSECNEKQAQLFLPENEKQLSHSVLLRDTKTKKFLSLPSEGVLLSEKLAKLLNVKEGERIFLKKEKNKKVAVEVKGIVENYMFHYVFLSSSSYQNAFGELPSPNSLFLSYQNPSSNYETKLGKELLASNGCSSIYFVSETKKQISSMSEVLNLVILVLILSAGLLAFVVLYNLNSINIMERKRELATLKVLGFYDSEVSTYIFHENLLLTFIGIFLGYLLGIVLHQFVVQTAETDLMMFGRQIHIMSYVLSSLITLLFSFCINGITHLVLKKIDMIESLKSVE